MYCISLFSEFLCNDKPIFVRFDGNSYFPIFRYYPDDVFTNSGRNTRPDYKAIAKLKSFVDNASNFMVFPPVPFGPEEIIDADSLEEQRKITVIVKPRQRIGTINIRKDFSISRATSSGYFFGTDDRSVRGLILTDYWAVSPKLNEAINTRFNNSKADNVSVSAVSKRDHNIKGIISLTPFNPRSNTPKTVRLTFREPESRDHRRQTVVFDESLNLVKDTSSIWTDISPSDREVIRNKVGIRLSRPVDSYNIVIHDKEYEVEFDKKDIRWPHPPVKGHWLGIDSAGRDVLARIVYGLRISMTFGFVLVFFSKTLGIVMGAIQGYYGGRVDIVTQRLIEIWSALPFLYIMILMGSIYGRSFSLLLFIYGIFNWIGISYYIRAEFLKTRKQPFVEAAKCMGMPAYKIIFKHILPNSLVPVITFLPFSLVGAIGSLAALDYLGFGLPPPTPSWGELLAQAQQIRWAWWLILYPSLALFTVMLLGVFVGEGVRNAFDPRNYSRME